MAVALIGLSALAGACVQATTGMGFALVLTPVTVALLSPVSAIVIVTTLGLGLNLLVLVGERRQPRVAWGEVIPILGAAIPGTICGVLVLAALPKPALQVTVGGALVAAALMRARAEPSSAHRGNAPARLAVGFTTGALTTSTGVSGPPLALWLSSRGLAPGEVRDSMSAMFLTIGVIGFVALVPLLPQAHVDSAVIAAGVTCVAGGHALGSRAFVRLDARRFQPLLMLVILVAGIASIVAGVTGL